MKKPNLPQNASVHMIGIAGSGMSGLAVVMAKLGYRVTGSDARPDGVRERMRALGIEVAGGHDQENVKNADLVVASAAIKSENPEIKAAEERGIPIISRAELLGKLMEGNFGIAVAGTHGKTTTTSMLAVVLEIAGLDPTILIGGELGLIGGNAKLGESGLFLAEACEAFSSFLCLSPKTAVITNIEADHLDCYGSLEGVIQSFEEFLSNIQPGGSAVVCVDSENVRKVIPGIREKVTTYGFSDDADWRAVDADISKPEPVFRVSRCGEDLGEFRLSVPGRHNVQNALAVLAVGFQLGIEVDVMRRALLQFHGAGRRFEVLGTARGITVVDDYAHHPTEVRATLEASRVMGRRVVAVFQPHLFSRTQLMADGFAESLKIADEVFLAEIYPAREQPIPGVSSTMLVERINADGSQKAHYYAEKKDLSSDLVSKLRDGDLLVVMGAGDIRTVAESVLAELSTQDKK